MMMGLPCISTTCAGSDELISDGKNGILVPVGDKEKMTTAINLLLNNDVLRLSLGKQAKIDSENYSVDKIYKKWKEIL
jgi:GalNAc-alpha-(1->4)-GalNAc-alpha-(1->3)-diNAcBac-PP-undecaprenol alpha-1,4-N-acetyl-D-galactosaminyltransferase